jgi:hypothetical protein
MLADLTKSGELINRKDKRGYRRPEWPKRPETSSLFDCRSNHTAGGRVGCEIGEGTSLPSRPPHSHPTGEVSRRSRVISFSPPAHLASAASDCNLPGEQPGRVGSETPDPRYPASGGSCSSLARRLRLTGELGRIRAEVPTISVEHASKAKIDRRFRGAIARKKSSYLSPTDQGQNQLLCGRQALLLGGALGDDGLNVVSQRRSNRVPIKRLLG